MRGGSSRLLAHELSHVALGDFSGPSGKWVEEGVCEYVSYGHPTARADLMRSLGGLLDGKRVSYRTTTFVDGRKRSLSTGFLPYSSGPTPGGARGLWHSRADTPLSSVQVSLDDEDYSAGTKAMFPSELDGKRRPGSGSRGTVERPRRRLFAIVPSSAWTASVSSVQESP